MQATEALNAAKEALTVKRIFGEPYEHDGVTVIPAAQVGGGAGGGMGHDNKGQEGEGGGFGLAGRPAGSFVIKGGEVKWVPAVDPNRLFAIAGVVAVVFLLVRGGIARARIRHT
ncbi:hypothetical protein JCM18899A_04950 [Nocardioides sp. AN3]